MTSTLETDNRPFNSVVSDPESNHYKVFQEAHTPSIGSTSIPRSFLFPVDALNPYSPFLPRSSQTFKTDLSY
ncbi:hypothetical protein PGT21_001114 [Puccinia graminis f. sp. tritici]|uniref:Uncharacterized protein n=1 Tax=Puccinia graminis f. sp. tritici TaxID=56615 RepID=A0A5B0NX34_PUCGR|nr:hypothetical protein PGT21_001114 [Puccinia graminis f. sp. tritici]KAA1105091.1 hypothetical protein PGTUg99_005818 [Puccinia graminis f. sp. tritici]